MAAVIAILILLAFLGLSFLPLVLSSEGGAGEGSERDPEADLQAQRRRLLDEIREIDMDLTMGKMNEQDHAVLRAGLESEAMAVLAELGELEESGEEE